MKTRVGAPMGYGYAMPALSGVLLRMTNKMPPTQLTKKKAGHKGALPKLTNEQVDVLIAEYGALTRGNKGDWIVKRSNELGISTHFLKQVVLGNVFYK